MIKVTFEIGDAKTVIQAETFSLIQRGIPLVQRAFEEFAWERSLGHKPTWEDHARRLGMPEKDWNIAR